RISRWPWGGRGTRRRWSCSVGRRSGPLGRATVSRVRRCSAFDLESLLSPYPCRPRVLLASVQLQLQLQIQLKLKIQLRLQLQPQEALSLCV
ncbi:unnamed protein product, partial [Laminaria digitata]